MYYCVIVAFCQHVLNEHAMLCYACAEIALILLPVQKLPSPLCSATTISYKTDAFPLPSDVYGIYSMFLCYYVA